MMPAPSTVFSTCDTRESARARGRMRERERERSGARVAGEKENDRKRECVYVYAETAASQRSRERGGGWCRPTCWSTLGPYQHIGMIVVRTTENIKVLSPPLSERTHAHAHAHAHTYTAHLTCPFIGTKESSSMLEVDVWGMFIYKKWGVCVVWNTLAYMYRGSSRSIEHPLLSPPFRRSAPQHCRRLKDLYSSSCEGWCSMLHFCIFVAALLLLLKCFEVLPLFLLYLLLLS